MDAPQLFASSFVVGLSGAMSPGPLLVVVMAETVKAGLVAPVLMMAGHALLELMMAGGLLLGLDRLRHIPGFEPGLSLTGGLVMIALAAAMLGNLSRTDLVIPAGGATSRTTGWGAIRLVGLGIGVSILNPYWTIWWLTIGANFMAVAGLATPRMAAVFYAGHILSDIVWYVFVGALVVWGRRFLGRGLYRGTIGGFAIILGLFGITFLRHGIRALRVML